MAWLSVAATLLVVASVTVGTLYPLELHHGGFNLAFQLSLPGGQKVTLATPFLYRLAIFGVTALPTALTVWMLLSLFRLFRLFAQGRVFDGDTLRLASRVASLLFVMVLAEIAAQPAVLYILGRAAGQQWFGYLIVGDELPRLFAAGAVVVIARMMAEAHRIADENAKFV
jgi:hypothetical protein